MLLLQKMPNSKYIYFDSAASNSLSEFSVVDNFANPNATHDAGRDAFAALEKARENFAYCIGAKRPSEIIWTSGATESNNIAIFGIARSARNKNNCDNARVIVLATEHESALNPAYALKEEGFIVDTLNVDKNGFADLVQLEESLRKKDTVLVIASHANTEIGSIQDIEKIAKLAHSYGAYIHCDCVGSFARIPVDVSKLDIDSASFSGHKIGAPKGIGVLYLKSKTPCKALILGGEQESNLRAGTQNISGAISFTNASQQLLSNMQTSSSKIRDLQNYMCENIEKRANVRLTIDPRSFPNKFLPNIINLVFKDKNSKNLILYFEKLNIIVSGGPACNSNSEKPSHVLEAINVSQDEINGTIRISFNENNTKSEIDKFLDAVKEI